MWKNKKEVSLKIQGIQDMNQHVNKIYPHFLELKKTFFVLFRETYETYIKEILWRQKDYTELISML